MDPKDLRGLTPAELLQKERDLKKELFHLRVQSVTGRVESPARIKTVRREIARVKTIAHQTAKSGTP
jgi:large subunit ribosomal protein L29